MKSNDLFRTLTTVTTGRPPFRKQNDIEVDDTAPVALFVGIALPVFIGFIILVLICCFCRRRRGAGQRNQMAQAANANYHRAPEADGMGPGAFPMAAVTNSYPGYPPGQTVGPTHYTAVPPGVHPPMHPVYPTQQVLPPAAAHFAGLQPYPPHQYMPIVPPATAAHHSLSHSSQASSVSGHTVDPLVPTSTPSGGGAPQHVMQQQQQQQQQHQYQQLQQQQHLYHHPQTSVMVSRQSPAPFHYTPTPYMVSQLSDHKAVIVSTTPTSTVSQTLISSPTNSKSPLSHTALAPLKDDGTDQDLGYSEGEE